MEDADEVEDEAAGVTPVSIYGLVSGKCLRVRRVFLTLVVRLSVDSILASHNPSKKNVSC